MKPSDGYMARFEDSLWDELCSVESETVPDEIAYAAMLKACVRTAGIAVDTLQSLWESGGQTVNADKVEAIFERIKVDMHAQYLAAKKRR